MRRVEQLYTEGLAAFYTEEWDKACRRFQTILSEYPNHKNAAEKLAEAEKQRNLAKLYARAGEEYKAENWPAVIQSLEDLLQKTPDYKDASQLLRNAKKQKRLKELYAEAKALHTAQKWQAVLKVFEQITAIEPACPDPDGLLPSAQNEVTELKRIADLNEQYSLAVRRMDSGEWLEARTLLEKVHKSQTGFMETERLLRKAETEITKAEEQNRQIEQVNVLYEQAHGLIRTKNWRKALDKIEEIQQLDSQFEDKDGIIQIAKAELAREEQEAQRQNELAAMYSEAARLLKEGKYQEALDKWREVREVDPKYPDRQWVQRTARKKLAEMTKPVQVRPRLVIKKSLWMGMAGFAVVTVGIIGITLLVNGNQQMLSALTSGNTAATSPATSVPYKSSTPRPATSAPVTGGYADPTMYDDFDASSDALDASRWEINREDLAAEITKQSGILTVKTNGYEKSIGLSPRRFQDLSIHEPFFIELRFKLEPNQNGGAGISLAASDNKGFTLCHIWEMQGTQAVVCQSFFGENKEIGAKEISSGTWHSARIEVDPSSMTFTYYIDGIKIGEDTPISAEELKSAKFYPSLGSGCSGPGCIDKSPEL